MLKTVLNFCVCRKTGFVSFQFHGEQGRRVGLRVVGRRDQQAPHHHAPSPEEARRVRLEELN